MQITSSAFKHEGLIPARHTCDGPGLNPPLSISEVPAEAVSLVLIMEDPDVPKFVREDGVWNHWLVFNISPLVTEVIEGAEPEGDHGMGTSGNREYHGPCPPDGEHRYYFRLFALDTRLDLPSGCSKEELVEAMEDHVLEEAVLMGRYARESS